MRHRLAVLAAAWVVAAAVGTGVAVVGHGGGNGPNVAFALASLLIGLCLALVGALLLRLRPGNRLGPLLYLMGASLVVQFALREYACTGLVARPGSALLPDVAGWAGLALDPLFFPVPFALSLLMFPDGQLPSRRWRPVAGIAVAIAAVQMLLLALRPGPLPDETYGYAIFVARCAAGQ